MISRQCDFFIDNYINKNKMADSKIINYVPDQDFSGERVDFAICKDILHSVSYPEMRRNMLRMLNIAKVAIVSFWFMDVDYEHNIMINNINAHEYFPSPMTLTQSIIPFGANVNVDLKFFDDKPYKTVVIILENKVHTPIQQEKKEEIEVKEEIEIKIEKKKSKK